MKRLLRRPSTYLAVPILLSCGFSRLTYDLPAGYLEGLLLLASLALAVMLFDQLAGAWLPAFERFRSRRYAGTRESFESASETSAA